MAALSEIEKLEARFRENPEGRYFAPENGPDCGRPLGELDPAHFSNPQLPLARIYLRRSEQEAALRELEDFLEHHPDSPTAPQVRAMIEEIQ